MIRTPHGWFAADGVSWDHDASIEVVALRGSLDQLFEFQHFAAATRGELVAADESRVDGRRVARVVSERRGAREEMQFQDWGGGWVLVTIAHAPLDDHSLYSGWFQLVYLSIDRVSTTPPALDNAETGVGDGTRR